MQKLVAIHKAFARMALPLALLSAATPLLAQSVPPGGQPSRQQVEIPSMPGTDRPSSRVEFDSSAVKGPSNCPLADNPASANLKVMLSEVRFEGPRGGALPAEIRGIVEAVRLPSRGVQPIAIVCTLRNNANVALRKAGYIASVQVPSQEIANGILHFTVIPAKLVEVHVVGDATGFRRTVAARADALMRIDPLNRFEAERILLLASDVPGLKIQLSLKPAGRGPGEVIGELKIDTQKVQLLANFENYGSRQLGREIVSLRGEVYGLTGRDDRAYLSYSNALQWRETHVLQGGYDLGLGGNGFRIGARASYALSNPDIPNLDLHSTSLIAGVDLSMPLVRAVNHNVRASGGIEFLTQRTVIRQSGSDTPFTRDRTRVLFARLDGDVRVISGNAFDLWDVATYAQVRKGLDVLGATPRFGGGSPFQPSRFDGDPEATVVSGEIRQSLHLTRRLTLDASAFGQWSNHALLNLEEFSIGNLTYGRGYDPGSNGADRVIAARVQPRWRIVGPGELLRTNLAIELTAFGDLVRLYNLDPGTIETNRTLRSVGGGMQVTIPNRMILGVLYARPLDFALATDTVKPPARVLVSLTTRVLPWRGR